MQLISVWVRSRIEREWNRKKSNYALMQPQTEKKHPQKQLKNDEKKSNSQDTHRIPWNEVSGAVLESQEKSVTKRQIRS